MRIYSALLAIAILATRGRGDWERLPPIPDKEGFAGSFAGVSGGALVVGGGANFPDKRPWEGGSKAWVDSVFVLERPEGAWKKAAALPRPLGYGVSVTYGDAVVCAGGSDGKRHYADVFRLQWQSGKLVTSMLPPLPRPVANACGALVGDVLVVAGGQEGPEAQATLKTVFALDLAAAAPRWQTLESWPGAPRMLAVAAACDGAFWLVGGVDLLPGAVAKRRYLRDAYRYKTGPGWKRVADLPLPLAAAPSPVPADAAGFWILGGDDGTQVNFMPPERHPGFRKQLLRYDHAADQWRDDSTAPVARVTVPLVRWQQGWVMPGGEVRPAVRSPEVWQFVPRTR